MSALKEMLIRHEGLALKPYKDTVGKLSIGVGRNLDDVGISNQEAMILLENDIGAAVREATKLPWFIKLDAVRKDVIISMIFNMGAPRFMSFKKTIALIEASKYSEAAHEMLNSSWAKQVGKRAVELSEMMKTGTYLKILIG